MASFSYPISEFEEQKQQLSQEVKQRSDRWLNYLLGLYFVIGLLIAGYYDTWWVAIIVGSSCLAAYYSAKVLVPHSALYQYVLSAVLGVFMAQFIYQMHGMFEMHFFAFIGSAVLITYQNWRLQLPIFMVVLLHHGIFGYLQDSGYKEIYFSQSESFDLAAYTIHILLTVFIFFVCGLWADQFKQYSNTQIEQTLLLADLQSQAVVNEEKRRYQQKLEAYNAQLLKANRILEEAQEAEQSARVEAEKANRAKGVFLATMSHEIRTPLNGIIGMSYLLAEASLMAQEKMYVNTITSCSESLLSVLNNILDFSKIEAGGMQLEHKAFNLRNCIEEVIDMFIVKAAQRGLGLSFHLQNNVPLIITGDKTRLQQVLINLTGNALKFTHQGKVHIQVALINQDSNGNLSLKFKVQDTGIGIPADNIQYLFKAFSQLESDHNRKYGGSGLGLIISKKLVVLMNGKLQVHSEPGVGSTFSFTIQSKLAGDAEKIVNNPGWPEHAGRQVLIIDDNETNRYILQTQLQNWGLKPVLATSATEGLTLLTNKMEVSLIITDAQMPGMSGLEFAHKAKACVPAIPIVLLSSIGDAAVGEYSKMFNQVLIKPVKQQILEHCILECLQKHTTPAKPNHKPRLTAEFGSQFPAEILVAEDNKVNQMLIKQLLKRLGYAPDIVNNGKEALEALASKTYNIIFMDIQMPEMDGMEATRNIRLQYELQPVIIALTANALKGDREECLKAGMNDYLSKPINVDDLLKALKNWVPVKVLGG